MPTPDWEEWLRRQDFDIEDTLTLDAYKRMLADELDIHGGSLDVAADVYDEKYNVMETLGIRPFDWRGTVRYQVEGLKGAWGREAVLNLGVDIAENMGLYDSAMLLAARLDKEFPRGD